MKLKTMFFAIFMFFMSGIAFPQITLKELSDYNSPSYDSLFYNITRTRNAINLNGAWTVYPADDETKKAKVIVPAAFAGNGSLIFEKKVSFSDQLIKNNRLVLNFLGLSYSAEILINDLVIAKHSGGEYPFSVELPRDILRLNTDNTISVKLYHKLSSEETIPVKKRFLFPENFGGIFRDVYIEVLPAISFNKFESSYTLSSDLKSATFSFKIDAANHSSRMEGNVRDTATRHLRVAVITSGQGTVPGKDVVETGLNIKPNRDRTASLQFTVAGPALWSPSNPVNYMITARIYDESNVLLDEVKLQSALYSLKAEDNSLRLNGSFFALKGTTYMPSYKNNGVLANLKRIKSDLTLIKETGFNAVRFAHASPHPYALKLCQELGLLAFCEIPVNSLPEDIISSYNFEERAKNYLANYLSKYKQYDALAAIGVGSGYLSDSDVHAALIGALAQNVKRTSGKLAYASFTGFKFPRIEGLDLYGVELINEPVSYLSKNAAPAEEQVGKGRFFVSDASYSSRSGSSNGYLNGHSYEGQAKFYSDLIDSVSQDSSAGFFINSMFDYRGDYASIIMGYSKDNVYKLGILGEDRNTNWISYKVVKAKLNDEEPVTIPIGTRRDDSPMIFIIYGLLIGLAMGIVVNANRKLREDATRALLRPYNFYADIRDQRILSNFHSNFLMIVFAATSALILANILFFLKDSFIFEKFILSFGGIKIMSAFSYLAWHPTQSLLWLTVFMIALLLLTVIAIKLFSLPLRNRVMLSNIYYASVWSFLPIILLIPVGLVLYKLLRIEAVSFYMFLILAFFGLWIFYRLTKSIYVVLDISSGKAYFYFTAVLVIIILGILAYFQIAESSMFYIINSYKQYVLMQ